MTARRRTGRRDAYAAIAALRGAGQGVVEHVGPFHAAVRHALALHVLLVDDNVAWRVAAARRMRDLGWRVDEAGAAGDALARTHEVVYDVVVLDHLLPGDAGPALVDQLRAEVCVVEVTAADSRAPGVVEKTADAAEVVAAVRRVVAAREAR